MSNETWVYHTPDFESDKVNPEMMMYSPWSGHRRFVYDLVADCRPECIVELGSYYGCSAFTFLQAIKDFELKTAFYAIDTWEGDSFTEEDYREDIYGSYKGVQDLCFSNQNALMMRMTFDDANEHFQDHSIDLLHIDGSHLYKDCKHDFETWLPKMKSEGVILFHDISEDKLDGEFLGSHLFWQELKQRYPYTLEFPYSFGLGVLCLSEKQYHAIVSRFEFEYYQKLENQSAVKFKDTIRKQYFELKSNRKYIVSLKEQVAISQKHLSKYEISQKEKDEYIKDLEARNADLTSICRSNESDIHRINSDYAHNLDEYKKQLEKKEAYISELLETKEKYRGTVEAKDQYIAQMEATVNGFKTDAAEKEKYIKKLERDAQEFSLTIQELSQDIARVNEDRETAVADYKRTVEDKERYISELKSSVDALNALLEKKNLYEQELKAAVDGYESMVAGKDSYIKELSETIAAYQENLEGKERYIGELQGQIADLSNKLEKCLIEIDYFKAQHQEHLQRLNEIQEELKQKRERLIDLEAELKKSMLTIHADQEHIMEMQKEMDKMAKYGSDEK